jgi:SSS family solute:Na+ symporter
MPLAFSTVDWWIVGIYMLIATIPGFLCRKYIKGQDDFLIAGRSLNIWLATATLTATEMGLITVMYMAQMGFQNGFSAMIVGVIAGGATLFVGLTGFMVAGLRRSGVTTLAEFYEKRYSRGVRVLGGIIIATAGILNYGVFLKVEAAFVSTITGVPDMTVYKVNGEWRVSLQKAPAHAGMTTPDPASTAPATSDADETQAAVPAGAKVYSISSIRLVMSILVVIVLLYVLLGGMVSVVLTDYVQFIVLTVGIGLTTWWVMTHPNVGGFAGMLDAVREHRSGYGLDPTITKEITNPVTGLKAAVGFGWIWIIWQCMHWTGSNTWQTQAFRTAATDSPRTAKIMWSLTAVNYFGRAIIPMLWGVAAIAYLSKTMSRTEFATLDSMKGMPMMLQHLPAGLVGFMLAGMLAALMSTHSSYMLAWSGVITEDLVVPILKLFGIQLPSWSRIWITRVFILCLGAFLIWFGLWYEFKDMVWGYLGVTGTMYVAGAVALIAMGLYWRRASTLGAYLGLVMGAAPGIVYLASRFLVLGFGSDNPDLPWYVKEVNDFMTDPVTGIMSFPLGLLGMIVGSLVSSGANRGAEPPMDDQLALAGAAGGDQ